MAKLLPLLRKELLEQWRTKKLLILGVVFLFIALSSPALAKLTPQLLASLGTEGITVTLPEPTAADALAQFVKNVSQIGVLVLVFVVAGTVSEEKAKRTFEILLTQPISRAAVIVAKFVAAFISLSVVFALTAAICYGYSSLLFSPFDLARYVLICLCLLLFLLLIAALTILASTVVQNLILAGGLGFLAFLLLNLLGSLPAPIRRYSPGLLLSEYQQISQHGWVSTLNIPVVITVLLLLGSVVAAIVLFQRQEIER